MESILADFSDYLASNSILAYPLALLAGILVSFTPCVYPIIPIQLGFIGAQTSFDSEAKTVTRFNLRGLILSILFVTGLSLVYSALGIFAALTGTLFGAWTTTPWSYLLIANIFLLMALSMLEVIVLPLPQLFANWNPAGKGYVSALLIGACSGLVVGSCTAPALGATLAYVGTQGSVLFGGSVLFVFAFGMGLLMILLGGFGGVVSSRLPRSGNWMVRIKTIFGILMILVAQYFLIEAGKRFI